MPTIRAERALLTLALLIFAGAPACAELGTLFTTPAERVQLDRLRRGEAAGPESAGAGDAPSAAVTGYVKRSDGRGTVWIDGRPVVVASPRAAPLFDARSVRAYARSADEVKVQRKPGR
jgi:hypothetical protein